jgi:hypothetical protein
MDFTALIHLTSNKKKKKKGNARSMRSACSEWFVYNGAIKKKIGIFEVFKEKHLNVEKN